MDTASRKPDIATILDDGTYGQREMTDTEYVEYLQVINASQEAAPE